MGSSPLDLLTVLGIGFAALVLIQVMVTAARPDPGPLGHFAELGVTAAVLPLPSAPADVVVPLLDRYAALLPAARV